MKLYRVWIQSTAGPYEQYDGYVDVVLHDDDENDDDGLFNAAVRQLRRTAFPDRGIPCWQMDRAQRLDD